jgi:hypothetical protein
VRGECIFSFSNVMICVVTMVSCDAVTPSPLAAISKYGTRIVTAASATSSDSKH